MNARKQARKSSVKFVALPLRALAYAYRHRLDGTLIFNATGEEDYRIGFRGGSPLRAQAEPTLSIGDALVRMKSLDAATFAGAQAASTRSGQPLDTILARCVSRDAMERACVARFFDQLRMILQLPQPTHVKVVTKQLLLEDVGYESEPIDPLHALLFGARLPCSARVVSEYVVRLRSMRLYLRSHFRADRLKLTRVEREIVDVLLQGSATLSELQELGFVGQATDAFLYALAVGEAIGARAPSVSSTPPGDDMRRSSYPDDSPPSDSPGHRAISEISKRISPPPPTSELPPAIEPVQKARRRAALANSLMAALGRSPSTPAMEKVVSEHEVDVITAEEAFRTAELAVRHLSFDGAMAAIEHALAQEPYEPRYRALKTWIQAEQKGPLRRRTADTHYQDAFRELDSILIDDPACASAYYFRARLYERIKKTKEARRDYEIAAELDSSNIDAARAARKYAAADKSPVSSG